MKLDRLTVCRRQEGIEAGVHALRVRPQEHFNRHEQGVYRPSDGCAGRLAP